MDADTQEGRLVPETEDLLGYCNECHRVRWLAVEDGRVGKPEDGKGMPFGTCRQCAREAQEGT